ADRNRSHWSTSKTPSYTKSVSWQHHLISLWLQIKHIIFLCVPFLRKPYFMRIMSRQKSINKRASQCG
ncbi:hypothetical protein, partial [Escherichia coli]|uniref:hypothetical protein n=1 Tax=Escherichia coli TaxID=562 RepID=UPI001E5A5086